ncbi:MAG: 2-succinyl-5-enolpyruvyl-6-hydroxy-3-cyclohexene-1-carboxylic-acid synthase [Propionibacterium sp.]|nr:2-succinyl-5-enolpyruvyl-6-hydroxy-3-cyclohexene-1-carboxylic-acid synthase [Propionibacterium sp.]
MSSVELGGTIVHTLHALGAGHFVVAPGSRNAPLTLALHALERSEGIDLHVAIDERSAAFRALGLAKATGRLAVVVVTSGSAVANLAPAALEARHAGVPLLLVTSDRPSEFVGSGAAQTADQVGIFGPTMLGVTRLASTSGAPAAWSAGVQRAAHLALGTRTREPGPVQLNVEFALPIVGSFEPAPLTVTRVSRSRGDDLVEFTGPARTVIVAGDATPAVGAEARALAELARVPLLAEPSSNARAGDCALAHGRELLTTAIADEIERVVVFGHPTLSRPQAALLSRADVEVVVVTDRATWHDPGHRAAVVADRVTLPEQDGAWLRRWQEADRRLAKAPGWGGKDIVDGVLQHLGASDNLVLGASNIIRDADVVPVSAHPPTVYASRGQAGIDGTIATASGIALGTGRPTTVLLGDITAQHDLGSLVRPPQEPRADLRVVVADDNGGALFHKLEQGAPEYADAFERVFATPQSVDLARVAEALGWTSVVVGTRGELDEALRGESDFVVARISRP